MTQKKKQKTARAHRPSVYTAFLFLLLLLSLAGCRAKDPAPAQTIDFSHHTDGSRITEEELRAYQDSVLTTLLITETDGVLTGTHTGLFSTVVSISLYDCTDKELLKNCFSLLAEYETVLSRTMPGSELYAVNLNTSGNTEVSADLAEVLSLGLSYRELSGNRFDITVAPLSDLWSFGSEGSAIPSSDAITEARSNVDGGKVSLDGTLLTYPAGTKFDLGAVAKGWLSDRIAAYLQEQGVSSAMINLGGNALALGEKPDGSAFRVGVTMPFSGSAELAEVLSVKNMSVVTSGIYERYFIENGTLYHHLLDATTGYPAENDLLSVTIVCENSAMADLLSTVCFLLGTEDGMALIEELNTRTEVSALFLTGTYDTETKQVLDLEYHYSEGFEEFIK
ncbi:MAG: FAD:protein FMN transferase [Lachnospiraceae bacterium]|nr:FAD:protein FMN transferase [Lachnospiraceae bacterium]